MSYFRSTAGRVVSCILYLIAGVLSGGIMVLFMGMQGSLGSGSPAITMYISLVGSLLSVVAAMTVWFRFRGTGYIALTGVIAVWTFYVAMMLSSMAPVARPVARSASRPNKTRLAVAPLVVVPLLLLGSLAYPIASLISARKAEA